MNQPIIYRSFQIYVYFGLLNVKNCNSRTCDLHVCEAYFLFGRYQIDLELRSNLYKRLSFYFMLTLHFKKMSSLDII